MKPFHIIQQSRSSIVMCLFLSTLASPLTASSERDVYWKREILGPCFEPYQGPLKRAQEIRIDEVPAAARPRLQGLKGYYDQYGEYDGLPSAFKGFYQITETVGDPIVAYAVWAYSPADVGHYEGGVINFFDANGKLIYQVWRGPSGTYDNWWD
jgi:hypothetical protein